MPSSTLDVFFNVDKPRGPTSHDVVARLRRASGVRRIGHAGTLDPLASGVLVVAVGRATRLIEYVADADKAYLAEITFGIHTDTYDAEGRVVAQADASRLTRDRVERGLGPFRGVIEQRPPAHSAISVGGKRLYQLARAGQQVEAPTRRVEITSLELREWQPPAATVFVECSKGTYIRSLAHDLGQTLGVGAHLSALVRTRVGRFSLDDATPLERLESALRDGSWKDAALSLEQAVAHVPEVQLSEDKVRVLTNGVPVPASGALPVGTLCRATGPDGRLVAMVELTEREGVRALRPRKVLMGGD